MEPVQSALRSPLDQLGRLLAHGAEQKRHPHICRWIVGALTRHEPLPFVHAVLACQREVREARVG